MLFYFLTVYMALWPIALNLILGFYSGADVLVIVCIGKISLRVGFIFSQKYGVDLVLV